MRGAAKRQVRQPVSSHQVPQEDHAGCAQADPGLYAIMSTQHTCLVGRVCVSASVCVCP